jgi:hypothetical protein
LAADSRSARTCTAAASKTSAHNKPTHEVFAGYLAPTSHECSSALLHP